MPEQVHVAVAVKRTPREALRTALGFLPDPLAKGASTKRVVVKPSIYDPGLVGNTNLELVRSVAGLFSSAMPVSLVESDNPLRTAEEAFERTSYTTLLNEGVRLVNLSTAECQQVQFDGGQFQSREMPSILHGDRLLLNLATMKAEPGITSVGAGVKNLFGLLPERDKSIYHGNIDQVLVDLLAIYRPDLTIIDLTDPVIGNREDGITRHLGGVIVGTDPVAVDAFCAELLGVDPLDVPFLTMAYDRGLGEILMDRISILGTDHQKRLLFEFFR